MFFNVKLSIFYEKNNRFVYVLCVLVHLSTESKRCSSMHESAGKVADKSGGVVSWPLFHEEVVKRCPKVVIGLEVQRFGLEVDDHIESLQEIVPNSAVDVALALHPFRQCGERTGDFR